MYFVTDVFYIPYNFFFFGGGGIFYSSKHVAN